MLQFSLEYIPVIFPTENCSHLLYVCWNKPFYYAFRHSESAGYTVFEEKNTDNFLPII